MPVWLIWDFWNFNCWWCPATWIHSVLKCTQGDRITRRNNWWSIVIRWGRQNIWWRWWRKRIYWPKGPNRIKKASDSRKWGLNYLFQLEKPCFSRDNFRFLHQDLWSPFGWGYWYLWIPFSWWLYSDKWEARGFFLINQPVHKLSDSSNLWVWNSVTSGVWMLR